MEILGNNRDRTDICGYTCLTFYLTIKVTVLYCAQSVGDGCACVLAGRPRESVVLTFDREEFLRQRLAVAVVASAWRGVQFAVCSVR